MTSRRLTLAVPETTSYFQWKWVEKSSNQLLIEGRRKFPLRNDCIASAVFVKPSTQSTLKLQILHYNNLGCCTKTEDLEFPVIRDTPSYNAPAGSAATRYAVEDNITPSYYVPASSVPSNNAVEDNNNINTPSSSNTMSVTEKKENSLQMDEDIVVTYDWEWIPDDPTVKTLTSAENFPNSMLCIEDAQRCIGEDDAGCLQLNSYINGECSKKELLSRSDPRLNTQRDVFDVDVTVVTRSRVSTLGNVKLRATYYRGRPRVDIRHWLNVRAVDWIPTQRGVALPPQRWVRLLEQRERVDKLLARIMRGETICEEFHIGGSLYCSMQSPFWTVQLRNKFKDRDSGEIKYCKKGVIMKKAEWTFIVNAAEEIKEKMPEIATASPCYLHDDHNNQVVKILSFFL